MSRDWRGGQLVLPANAPRTQWLDARRAGITATDVVAIVGLSRYGSALDVYLAKRLGEEDRAPSEAARWGHVLEDAIAREWAARRGARIRRVGLMRNRTHPTHMATCDRVLIGAPDLLEVKTRSAWQGDEWDDGAVPDRVAVQTQWQLHVTGAQRAHIAALLGGQELVERTVYYDADVVAWLRGEAERVWSAVQAGEPPEVPPDALTAAALDRLHPDRSGHIDVDPRAALPLLGAYTAAAAAAKAADAEKAAAKAALVALLGDADTALIGGQVAWTYLRPAPKPTIPAPAVRALLADHPDLVADYVQIRQDAPRINVKELTPA